MKLTREAVLQLYQALPFEHHPLWRAILNGQLTIEQVLRAETQHYIRSRVGRGYRKRAAEDAKPISERAHQLLLETYKEECTDDETGPSHLDLIARLLLTSGVPQQALDTATPTAGNAAAMALYKDIAQRGPLHHMIGAGAVEFYYSQVSPRVFESYVTRYGLSEEQAETYKIHGPMDREHAERALSVSDEKYAQERADDLLLAVRDAFVATSLHYDGMLQAATGELSYWDGK